MASSETIAEDFGHSKVPRGRADDRSVIKDTEVLWAAIGAAVFQAGHPFHDDTQRRRLRRTYHRPPKMVELITLGPVEFESLSLA